MFEWPGHEVSLPDSLTLSKKMAVDQKQFALGRQHYLTNCAGCHGSDGAGLKRFAPPLSKSEWVTGNEKRLTLIILHGLEGPIKVAGKQYNTPDILPVMPSLAKMDDDAISAIMNYVRNAWGNQADVISPNLVGKTRHTSQGKVQPWTPDALNAFLNKTN